MPVQTTTFDESHELIVHDQLGCPALTLTQQKITIIDPTGQTSERHRDAGILLVDGLFWLPHMLHCANPILLTVCSTCRNPPVHLFKREPATHGLLSVRNARVCLGCGDVTCPRHRRLNEGQWFCAACAGTRRIRNLIRPLFFRKES